MTNNTLSAPILQRYIYSCRKTFWYLFLFSFISNLLLLALPIYSLQVMDRVLSSGSIATLTMLSALVLLSFMGIAGIGLVRSIILIRMGDWLEREISPELLADTVSYNANNKQAVSGSQNLRDFQVVKTFLTGSTFSSLMDLPWSIIFITMLFFVHSVIGVISVAGISIMFLIGSLNEKVTKSLLNKSNEQFIRTMGRIEAITRNSEVIEAMGMLPAVLKNFKNSNSETLNLQTRASNYSAYYGAISKFLRLALQIAITCACAILILDHKISPGAYIASSILFSRSISPFENVISSWKGFLGARKSYERIDKSLNRKVERDMLIKLPVPTGMITLENVYFLIPGSDKPTIKGISFNLNPGEILAIVGPSAAGKSTLARLIAGIWKANNGSIRLDGADVYRWNREDFGQYVGYLPQDVELFSGNVKDNIARMHKGASSESVIKAAQIAGVHHMILKLPKGYETEIGADGMALSAGQRQRIGLARAFYGEPKLVILDEPNSNLDSEGEEALLGALRYAKANKITAIFITHRMSIISIADKILVMQDGMTKMFGYRNEILRSLSEQESNIKSLQKIPPANKKLPNKHIKETPDQVAA